MPGKRNQTERNVLGKEIGLVPDHFKFMIVDDVDPVDIFQITAQRGAVNVLIFHHIQIKLEVMRGHFPVFPFLSRDGVPEVVPEDSPAEFDAVFEFVGRDRPGLRQHRFECARTVIRIVAVGEGVHGLGPDFRNVGVIGDEHIHIADIRAERRDEASPLIRILIVVLTVCDIGACAVRRRGLIA